MDDCINKYPEAKAMLSKIILLILIILQPAPCFGQKRDSNEYSKLSVKEGSNIKIGNFDNNGDLEAETVSWLRVVAGGELGPAGKEIRDLAIGPLGSLWVATNRGLSCLVNGRFQHFTSANLLPDNQVFKIAATSKGIAVATKGGLVWLSVAGSTVQKANLLTQGFITSLVMTQEEGHAVLWFLKTKAGANSKIGRIDFKDGNPVIASYKMETLDERIRKILPGDNEGLLCQDPRRRWGWLNTKRISEKISRNTKRISEKARFDVSGAIHWNDTLYFLTRKRLHVLKRDDKWPDTDFIDLELGSGAAAIALGHNNESLWISRSGSLWQLNSALEFEHRFLLPSKIEPTAIAEDLLGRLWIGGPNGLFMTDRQRSTTVLQPIVDPKQLKTYDSRLLKKGVSAEQSRPVSAESAVAKTENTGEKPKGIRSAGFLNDGRIWAITGRTLRVDANGLNQPVYYPFDSEILDAMLEDQWFVRTRKGLFRKNNGKFEKFAESKNIAEEKPFLASNQKIIAVKTANKETKEYEIFDTDAEMRFFKIRQPLKIGDVSQVISNPSNKDIFTTDESGKELYRIDRNLNVDKWSLPSMQEIPDQIFIKGISDATTGQFIAMYSHAIWYLDKKNQWKSVLEISEDRTAYKIAGILPDQKGDGVLIGYYHTKANLIYLKGTSDITSSKLPVNWIGGFNSAILRDSKGRVWAGSNKGVFMRNPENAPFEFTQVASADSIYSILEGPRGRIWVAGWRDQSQGFLEFIDEKLVNHYISEKDYAEKLPAVASDSEIIPAALGSFIAPDSNLNGIWVGGLNVFASIDPETLAFTSHLSKLIDAVLLEAVKPDSNRDIYAMGFAKDKDALLVLTNFGLYRLHDDLSLTKVKLPEWPVNPKEYIKILQLKDKKNMDRIIVKARTELDGTRIWEKYKGESEFVLVGDFDENIRHLAEARNGRVLLGSADGKLFYLTNGKLELRSDIREQIKAQGLSAPLRCLCPLGDGKFLVLGGLAQPSIVSIEREEVEYNRLEIELEPWRECVVLPNKLHLLLHEDKFTIISLNGKKISETPLPEKIHRIAQIADRNNPNQMDVVWMLGDKSIWKFGTEDTIPVKLIDLPAELKNLAGNLEFAADRGGFWVGTRGIGLWRLPLDLYELGTENLNNLAETEYWEVWDDLDGLQSRSIDGVVARNDREAVVFTPEGVAYAKRDSQSPWQFGTPQLKAVSGSEVYTAILFRDKEKNNVLALGTNKGVSLVYWKDGQWSESETRFFHFSDTEGLMGAEATALSWHSEKAELWVGANKGLTAYELSIKSDRSVDLKLKYQLSTQQGLPPGKVKKIKVGDDNVWILSENQISRFGRKDNRIVSVEPFLFSAASSIELGPLLNSTPPQVLQSFDNANWGVWTPSAYIQPKLRIQEGFFTITAVPEIESLDPRLENHNLWKTRYSMDRISNIPFLGPRFINPNLSNYQKEHMITAELTSLNSDASDRYIVSISFKELQSTYTVRLLFFIVFLFGFLAFLSWRSIQLFNRRKKLRKRIIPYISGKAIKNPALFFGREPLMRKLKSTIATHSYALIGEWRIGKSSIQHQLKLRLEESDNKEYAFFPFFMDLSKVGEAKDDSFFYFLGEHLVQLAKTHKKHKVPNRIISKLKFSQIEVTSPEEYTAQKLERDIEKILKFWSDQTLPKKPVIVFQIDESSLLETLKYDTLLMLRSVFVNFDHVQVVFSGKTIPPDQEGGNLSPWSNFMPEPIEVLPLGPKDQKKLVVEPAKGLFTYTNNAIDEICARSEGKPEIIQDICKNILLYKYDSLILNKKIRTKDLRAVIKMQKKYIRKEK